MSSSRPAGDAGDPILGPDLRGALGRHPTRVAPALLGAFLTSDVGGRVRVRITEVEAYGGVGEDPGSHAHRRRSDRNATMFGPPGHAYVYFTYGMHWCLNVVAHDPGVAGAVLIRAGEVFEGVELAHARRPAARFERELARGPARLAAALGVTRDLDGVDLLDSDSPLRLELAAGARDSGPHPDDRVASLRPGIGTGPRTGVAGAGAATPWRFWILGDPTVSTHRPAASRQARRRTRERR